MIFFSFFFKNVLQDMNDADEDDNGNLKQPLLYLMINQPNLYLWQQNLSQKMQVRYYLTLIFITI